MKSLQERITDLERKVRHLRGRGTTPNQYTTAQRDAVSPLIEGKIIYNSDTNTNEYYNGTSWVEVGGSSGGIGTLQQVLDAGSNLEAEININIGGADHSELYGDNERLSINCHNDSTGENFGVSAQSDKVQLAAIGQDGVTTVVNITPTTATISKNFAEAKSIATDLQSALDNGSTLDKDNKIFVGENYFDETAGDADFVGIASERIIRKEFQRFYVQTDADNYVQADIYPDRLYVQAYDGTNYTEYRIKPTGATIARDGGVEKEIATVNYKVYTALLTQSGADAPVATVLENTIGDIVWSRTSAGLYLATLAGAFTTDKTFTPPFGTAGVIFLGTDSYQVTPNTENDVLLSVYDASFNPKELSAATPSQICLEIRVYQ